jgi:hypothetical protein
MLHHVLETFLIFGKIGGGIGETVEFYRGQARNHRRTSNLAFSDLFRYVFWRRSSSRSFWSHFSFGFPLYVRKKFQIRLPSSLNRPKSESRLVWVNTATGIYHYSGTRWYGKTKQLNS